MLAMGLSPSQPGTAPNQQAEMIKMIGMFVLMGVIFYFMLIRPQRVRAKQQADLLKAIKPGDHIVTSSGIVAIVVSVKEKNLTVRSADTKLEILKSAVAEITERSGETKEA
jgi:preprotein translocase subunit YajC